MVRPAHRTLFALTAAVCMSLALGTTAQAQDGDFKWPRLMAIGTPSSQTGTFAATNGWAPILQQSTGTTVRIVPEDNEVQRFRRLNERRDIALSALSTAEFRFQTEGLGGYAAVKPAAQRVVWHSNDTPWGLVVAGPSEFQSTDDLKKDGIRVADGVFSPTITMTIHNALPRFLGIPEDEIDKTMKFVPASSYTENCRMVVEGKVDVAYCSPISAVLSEMEGAPGGIRWLPMSLENKEGWDGWLSYRPASVPGTIDMGVSTARGVPGVVSNFLYVVPADADEELIYNLAKWMHESYDDYKGTHPLAARMSLEQFRAYLDRAPFPAHPGTIKYLREIGAWSDADDEWNEAAAAKMDQWTEARQAAMDEATKSRIKIDFRDEKFLDILRKHTEGLEIFRSRL